MIIYKQVDPTYFPLYDQIPMKVLVSSYYRIEKSNRGLEGFILVETSIEPYIKDFCIGENKTIDNIKQFDLANWAFFMAFSNNRPIGAVAVAARDKGVNMLAGRDDLAVLWDIRVNEEYKHQGVGQKLFDMAVKWSRDIGLHQMKIECQNVNVPAIKFYHKQGAILSEINEYAYYNDPLFQHETQLIWYLDL